MKKLFALLLALVLMAASLPPAAADGDADVIFSIPQVLLPLREGGEAVATVSIFYETTEFLLDGTLVVTYDPEALELQLPKVENTLCKLANGVVNANQPGVIRIAFMAASGLEKTGTVAVLPFKVLDTQREGAYEIAVYAQWLACDDGTISGRSLVTDTQNFLATGEIGTYITDFTLLKAAVDNAETKLYLYTDDTAAAYAAALEAAKAVLADTAAFQQEVDGALAALNAAAQALVERPPVTPEELTQQVEEAVTDLSAYTEESADAYIAALNAARKVLADPATTSENLALALATLTAAKKELTEKPVLTGDADGNREITSTDARLTLQLAVNKINAGDVSDPDALDVNHDGSVTSTDARLVLQMAVGKITEWP